ncbi:MAG: SusE domain-containing protein [Flavobacterium sp.]|nr:SusE domain-containing protein [Flavobacterium sp.]
MKNILKTLSVILLTLFTISCEDEQDLMFSVPEGSFSIITPTSGESVVLSEATLSNPALTLTWSPMDYTTPTAVTYTVQIALDGTDFANPIDLGTTTNTNATFLSNEFNLKCLEAGATPFVQSAINIRIKASTGSTGSQEVYSNTINYLVTCFGCLNQYAVGSALTQSGWDWSTPRVLLCDNGVLTMTADFTNASGTAFRFFTNQGDWSSGRNYPWYVNEGYKIVSTLTDALDGDNNFKMNGTSGRYKLTLDTNNKTINMAKRTLTTGDLDLEPTSDWLVGAATPGGWSWAGNSETEFGEVSNGIHEVALRLTNNETFRVFLNNNGGDSWDLGSRNYPWYVNEGYTIDSELINANDGDSNFRYTGPTAIRILRINSITKVIEVL